jgi:hypothetical protein
MNKTNKTGWCNSSEHTWTPSRREFLFAGAVGVGGLGLTMGDLFRLQAEEASQPSKEGKAKSVIQIYLPGGMAHQESFDPKYLAPIEYRGPLGTVKTSTGELFSEHMKNTAKIADKITVVRSMTHGEAAHERGTHNMMTGNRPSPALEYPSIGAVVSHEFGPRKNLPAYVAIPSVSGYGGTGYLGSAYGAFSLGADPGNASFRVRDLSLPTGIDDKRFDTRRKMRAAVDAHFSSLEKADALEGMDSFYQRAYSMISSDAARAAFDLEKEDAKLRDEYGRNTAGQRMIMARRLVESGVRLVSLTFGGWDHHDNIKRAMDNQMPTFDQAFAALIRDLDQRGMLDSTLVTITSEFGRTPKINTTAGRDHWPKVFSIVMAGGGVKRGYIHGASDATGAEPDNSPLTVDGYASTLFTLMGINPDKRLMSPGGRPQAIVTDTRGHAEKDLLA